MAPLLHDVEAEVTFLPTEHGGRQGPVASDYRGQFYYDGHDWDAPQEYPDTDWVQLGEKVRAFVDFLSPHEHEGKVYPGMPFLIREGNRVVGYGAITKIVALPQSAEKARRGKDA